MPSIHSREICPILDMSGSRRRSTVKNKHNVTEIPLLVLLRCLSGNRGVDVACERVDRVCVGSFRVSLATIW